jgi:hypothetical protein
MKQLILLLVIVSLFISLSDETAASEPQTKILFHRADGTETELSEEELMRIVTQQSKQSPLSTENKREKLDEIAEKDPVFALNIQLAHMAFREIQRNGYGSGYKLQGFSEQILTENKKPPTSNGKDEYKVSLYLRAKAIDLTKLPKHADPEILYEVNLALESERR